MQKEEALKSMRRKNSAEGSERPGNGQSRHYQHHHHSMARKSSDNGHLPQRYDHTVATSPNSYTTGDLATQYNPHAHQRLVMSHSTSESILSNPSLLSNGQGDDDVDDQDDDDDDEDFPSRPGFSTIDDFDQFKDHNVEKMRSSLQSRVQGMDGMMSQALTRSILVPVSDFMDYNDGVEMEVNIIWEVNDWVKRNDHASFDEK